MPKIVRFRNWLLAEAANDVRRLKKIGAGVRSTSGAKS
jgi:hypothetical protein